MLTPGSSGGLYAQIANGLPFDVFLSSDITRPQSAERDGLGVAGTRFIYARGRLVLFSRIIGFVDQEGSVLKANNIHWLALPDPATVPYGAAAIQTLKSLGLYQSLEKKLLTGACTMQADDPARLCRLGFVAQSQPMNEPIGSRWVVLRSGLMGSRRGVPDWRSQARRDRVPRPPQSHPRCLCRPCKTGPLPYKRPSSCSPRWR